MSRFVRTNARRARSTIFGDRSATPKAFLRLPESASPSGITIGNPLCAVVLSTASTRATVSFGAKHTGGPRASSAATTPAAISLARAGAPRAPRARPAPRAKLFLVKRRVVDGVTHPNRHRHADEEGHEVPDASRTLEHDDHE